MKTTAVLISFLVLFLNAVPCCWETCSEEDHKAKTEQSSDSESACSPFLSCGSCTGFVLQQENFEFTYFKVSFPLLDVQKEVSFQSDYSIEIWQPPKEV